MTIAEITDRLTLATDVVDDLWENLEDDWPDDALRGLFEYRLIEVRLQLGRMLRELELRL
jgi:hypothetical protein